MCKSHVQTLTMSKVWTVFQSFYIFLAASLFLKTIGIELNLKIPDSLIPASVGISSPELSSHQGKKQKTRALLHLLPALLRYEHACSHIPHKILQFF